MSNNISTKLHQCFLIVILLCGLTLSVNAQKSTNKGKSQTTKNQVNPIDIHLDFVIEDDIMQSNGNTDNNGDKENKNVIANINKLSSDSNDGFNKLNENTSASNSLIKLENEIKIYPVPAVSFTNLDLGTVNASQLDIVNSLGQVVNSLQINQQQLLRLDISNLNTGIYYFRINTEEQLIVTKTVVVQ